MADNLLTSWMITAAVETAKLEVAMDELAFHISFPQGGNRVGCVMDRVIKHHQNLTHTIKALKNCLEHNDHA